MNLQPVRPRIAIFGLHLEANSFAPVTVEEDFVRLCWAEGAVIDGMARGESVLPSEISGFYARMDSLGNWQPVPLIVAAAPPGGRIDDPLFKKIAGIVKERLRVALPVDAVYIGSHGASASVDDEDSDGTLVALARELVGPGVPIAVTHDLHCNVSDRLVGSRCVDRLPH